jgi:hypothetical protein
MSESMELVCEQGVVQFDGKVVEVFGFGQTEHPLRFHVQMLKEIQVNEGGRFSDPFVSFKARHMNREGMAILTKEEAASPEVEKLVDSVRAAAPNLEKDG